MRLEYNDQAAIGPGLTRGFQCGHYFSRVVAVVVDQGQLVALMDDLEPPLHSGKTFDRRGDIGKGDSSYNFV